jgi:predicted phage terminase large subunit-like protein
MTPDLANPAFIKTLPSLLDVQRALAERHLRHFFVQAWPHYKPGRRYGHNWHIDAVCDHVQAVLEGQIKKLIINIPHRHTKSSIVAVAANAWEWGPRNRSWTQWIGASGTMKNATRDAKETRNLLRSNWFQSQWGDRVKLRADQNEKVNFENVNGGARLSLSAGSGGIGSNADRVFCDDPNDPQQGINGFTQVAEWWDDTMSSRLNDPESGGMFVIQQRLDERDLTGHLLEQGGWELLMLPAEFEPERRCIIVPTGFKDPRTEAGEPLDPVRHGRPWIDAEKQRLQSYRAAGMLQQRPAPKDGGLFKRSFYKTIKRADLPGFFSILLSWDTASTEDQTNDQTACTVWGLSSEPGKTGFFKLGQYADWLEIPDIIRKVLDYRQNWIGGQLLIENKNSGPAVIQHLQRKAIPVTAIEPKGGKEDRAIRCVPIFESGLVWLIEEDEDDNTVFLGQSDVFPRGRLRDVFDSAIQAIEYGITTYTFEAGGWSYEGSSSADSTDEDDRNDDSW